MARNRRTRKGKGQQIIANMGLFWKREKVNWGSPGPGREGKLLGVSKSAKRAGEVNFWEQTGIYALYDADYHLIYVGQAGFGSGENSQIGNRLKHHNRDELAGRWEMFSWFGLRKVKKNNVLGSAPARRSGSRTDIGNVLEGILIEVAEPFMNKQRGKLKPAKLYTQKPWVDDQDTNAHKKILDEISKLPAKLKKIIRKAN